MKSKQLKPFKAWILKYKNEDTSYSSLIHPTKKYALEINKGDKNSEAVQVLITPVRK